MVQPKHKGKMKSSPDSKPPATVKMEHLAPVKSEGNLVDAKKAVHDLLSAVSGAIVPAAPAADVSTVPDDPMDTAWEEEQPPEMDEEDSVVFEVDVFFTPPPLDEDTQLYVMQYPLRPSWRPFELNERCEEVRVKPKQSKLEVDLRVVVDEEAYLEDTAESLNYKKQTLSSSKAPFVTDYAVGIMIENQLHLNPVHAVVQLRHSKEYLSAVQTRRQSVRSREVKTSEENIGSSSKSSAKQQEKVSEDLNEHIADAEPWVPLEYHAADSPLSGIYKQKMVAEVHDDIQFTMTPSDFVKSLCPGISTSKILKTPPKWVFDSLPLEEYLKRWLTEVSEVVRFIVLMHYAPANSSDDDVLRVLQLHADLVQGLWVAKSSLVCTGRLAHARDYILFLFSKNRTFPLDKLKALNTSDLKRMLVPLAKARPKLNDVKFIEETDESFKKRYPHIVEEQNRAWSAREKDIMDSLRAPCVVTKTTINPNIAKKGIIPVKINRGANRGKEGAPSSTSTTSTALSNEAREALPKALFKLFQQQKVLSLSSITRGIRDTALRKSSLRRDDQDKETFVHAANGVSANLPEVISVISELAVEIHGLYVLKSVENTEISPLRNIVIKLFLEREPNAKFQKQEIINAAKVSLNREISDSEYNQLCILCVHLSVMYVFLSILFSRRMHSITMFAKI